MIFVLLLFFISVYVILFAKKDKTFFYIYNLCLVVFGPFIGLKLNCPSISVIYHIIPLACLLSLAPFFYKKKYVKYVFFYLLALVLYLTFKSIFWNISAVKFFAILKNATFCACCCISMVEFYNQGQLNIKKIVNGIYCIVVLQVIIAIGQYYIPAVSNFFDVIVFEDGTEIQDFSSKLNNMRIIAGTMITPSNLACFLSSSFFVLFLNEIISPCKSRLKMSILLLTLVALFYTGIRTPFIILIIFLLVYTIIMQKMKYALLIMVPIIVLLLFFSRFMDIEGAAGRMFQGIGLLSGGLTGLGESTFFYSIMMIPFFFQDPLFGVSLYNVTGYQLAAGIYVNEMSVTDLYLMYLLCEVGIIGVLLYIYPLFRMRKLLPMKTNKKVFLLVIMFGIFLGIVDQGIFHYSVLIVLLQGVVMYTINDSQRNQNVQI